MNKFLKNILAGASQQEDDTVEYREVPHTTIYKPNGDPYLTVINDGEIVKIRIHSYDLTNRIYLTLDKKCIPDLINALEQYK